MARSCPTPELWAGIECARTRIADREPDQLARTGHLDRLEDLERIAALGIRVLRYPILWEHVVPHPDATPDWRWADERMAALRDLGIRPIVGLLHHGMGPHPAGFDDPRFVERFTAYARSVAERYPWVTDFLPINEPLTTARFSGLYGFWWPHARDDRAFARFLEVQLRASVRAIEAIREVTPQARFIQNEDIGSILAVPRLREQAAYENERRWVVYDLLTGQLQPGMRMWRTLRDAGIPEHRLRWFEEHACPPDILAIDQYLTSDRLLDDRMHRYPARAHGGNGTQCYADIEAVRATATEAPGILPVLREAWARYRRPLAIGEAHLGSTRDEQLRWLRDVWRAAKQAASEGVDVRGVTSWALFGSYDWNSLLIQEHGYYEPGAFDLRDGAPRATALSAMLRAYAAGELFDHPVLDADGWWRRDDRLLVPPVKVPAVPYTEPRLPSAAASEPRRLVLAGTDQDVLEAVVRIAEVRALPTIALAHEHLAIDAGEPLTQMRAWAVLDATVCAATHATGARTEALARACRDARIPLVLLAGLHRCAFDDAACRSDERAREQRVRAIHDQVLVIEPGDLLHPWLADDPIVRALRGDEVSSMRTVTPAYLPDVVNCTLDLLIDGDAGSWRMDHGAACELGALAEATLVGAAGGDPVLPALRAAAATSERRRYPLPSLLDAVSRFVAESEPLWRTDRTEVPEPEVIELDAGPGMRFPATEPDETMTPADEVRSTADGAA